MNKIKALKGTFDILPGEIKTWQRIERVVRNMMSVYGYSEIRTPLFEETGLFARSIGEDTDIVGKEMYTFSDMGNRSITLRPEETAPVVRAFIEHSLDQKGLPQKFWYMGPMFRQERPQKGRHRQFHQFGVEVLGSPSPMVDAEVMILFDSIARDLGLRERMYSLNSLGGRESRDTYRKALVMFLDTIDDRLCEDCKRRKVTNPLRVLDCKVPECREVIHNSMELPHSVDYLTPQDRNSFETVQECLHEQGIRFVIDMFLVRGLDYYTGTVFAMNYGGLGAQSEIMGGGRYDNLVKELGGHDLPAVGFACGIERLILAMKESGSADNDGNTIHIYVVNTADISQRLALEYLYQIRRLEIPADIDYLGRSMKAQMKIAAKRRAKYVLIIEPEAGIVTVRNMEISEQKRMSFDEFIAVLKKDNSIRITRNTLT